MTQQKGKKVPRSSLARMSSLGGFLAQVAGNVAVEGAKQIVRGNSPRLSDLLLRPKNIDNLADKLAQLRGAAMKVGQLLSMDDGELLPKELSQLLIRLRAQAHSMPHKQLLQVLEANWGTQWLDQFSHFSLSPFAAASIGQVHLAYDQRAQKLAVKVQYPGVRESIDSDVNNVAKLLALSGVLPKQVDLDTLLAHAKKQLKVEADYLLEAEFNRRYANLLSDQTQFVIPAVLVEQCTKNILVMRHVDGSAIDLAIDQPQQQRNDIMTHLLSLFFNELFDFKLMQTDANFANYLYQSEQQKIVLLDFGATREINSTISRGYLLLICAAIENDQAAMQSAAEQIGFFQQHLDEAYLTQVCQAFRLATEPLRYAGEYDFAHSDLAARIKDTGIAIKNNQTQWHTPPIDAIFIHRKLAGLYLLAAKLQAKVDVGALFKPYQETTCN